ncbi:MAG: glycerol-3-phosphate dehydrogenase/oxidase [Myxococcota bacterium]
MADRDDRMTRLGDRTFDLLVVGGGITGAGIARDAALRGLSVALVERSDFGSGTSSRSSKLVHGGLRYLENFEFGLVFEATRERAIQRKLNPNLVWPLPFLFPVYEGDRNSLFKVNLGLWLYDVLSLFRAYRLHRRMRPSRSREVAPALRSEGLQGSVHYWDCRTDDARLTLANVLDAERHGAVALSYARYAGPRFDGEQVVGARVVDEETGREIDVQCRHIAYAGGPWTDALPGAPGQGHLLRPTKGVHIVVDRARLEVDAAVVMTAVQDGRVVFAIPSEDITYIGTTDTDYDGDFDQVRATSDDVSYLLTTANHYFPDARLTAADVRSSWAGLRPLVRSEAASAYETSREHQRWDDPRGITTIAGGKLTTYRSMAAEVVDAAVRRLTRVAHLAPGKCRTHKVPLDPDLPPVEDPVRGPADPLDRELWRRHGSGMTRIRAWMDEDPALGLRLVGDGTQTMAQVSYAVVAEHARRLEDVLVRRLEVFYRAPDQGRACARPVAEHMAALLERGADWVDAEVSSYEALVERSRMGPRALVALDEGAGAAPAEHVAEDVAEQAAPPDKPGVLGAS